MSDSLKSFKHLKSLSLLLMLVFVVNQSFAVKSTCHKQMNHDGHEVSNELNSEHDHHNMVGMNHESISADSISNTAEIEPQFNCCNSGCECAQNSCTSIQILLSHSPLKSSYNSSASLLAQPIILSLSDFPNSLYRPPISS